jgi:hypothetical protein
MPYLTCIEPISNIRAKLMNFIVDDHNQTINKSETLINSNRQKLLQPIVKTINDTVLLSNSDKNTTSNSNRSYFVQTENTDKFEKAMKSYYYLQIYSGKGSRHSINTPKKLKKISLKAHPIKDSNIIRHQTDKALQTMNFDNLTNIIIEKTNDSKKKSMKKKELNIDTEFETSEFYKMVPSPSDLKKVKSTMSNLSHCSNDFTIKMNRCVTTSSNSSYSSHYMMNEDCYKYYDHDESGEYFNRFEEFHIRLKSCMRRDRTLSQITPTSSDLELN